MNKFIVSLRGKEQHTPINDVLEKNYISILDNVSSVFTFVEPSPLYGGRAYSGNTLSNIDIDWLYNNGIGIRLPFTNMFPTLDMYNQSKYILDKYNRKGNSIILYNNMFVDRIRDEFPNYKLELSVIADPKPSRVDEYLETFDSVVLHGRFNNKLDLLSTITSKERVILFAYMRCAYNCPDKVCYKYFSQLNSNQSISYPSCSKQDIHREDLGLIQFNLGPLIDIGFNTFKILPKYGNLV